MPRTRSWASLLPGIAALAALIGGAIGVLAFARVGDLHGRTVPLYAAVSEARGVVSGSEVVLGGQKIGVVTSVAYRPPSLDTSRRVLLSLKVLAQDLPFLRRGAPVDIRAGGSIIGAPVVSIDLGRVGQPLVQPGDTLLGSLTDLDRARVSFDAATSAVPLVIDNLRLIGAQLTSARSTLGAFGIEGGPEMGRVAATASRAMTVVSQGRGTIGHALSGGALIGRAQEAMARADSIRQLFADPQATGPIGRFRRDSTLPRIVASVRADLDDVAQALAESRGTAGRLQRDSALVQQVAHSRAELAALAEDIKRHPLRYIVF